MAGNSSRRGAIKRTGKGNPTAGSGGRVKRGLEGRGPTPKAKDREGHVAYKNRQRAEKKAAPRRRPAAKGDADWVAGRNSVVEALRAHMPVSAVYVAEGAERDGRLREVFRVAADRGISLLEVARVELDRITDGAVHQGLAARRPTSTPTLRTCWTGPPPQASHLSSSRSTP
jgi:23S rRNA (guanosine2251-2'-O)-methyltransferase